MPAPGLVDLKRRQRLASRVLLSDAHRGDTACKHLGTQPSSEREQVALVNRCSNEPAAILFSGVIGDDILLAESVSSEPESCCTRCLRLLPRSVRLKVDASVELA
eukprot:COSAG05_NODE_6096_length_1022_cov_1.646804_2_plen_105_part_00